MGKHYIHGKSVTIMTRVTFFSPESLSDRQLTYSVIAARFSGKWIFVRHQDRRTWEIAGGHIEAGESADDAARRELMEETGAVSFSLVCVSAYSVELNGSSGYGKLYYAGVDEMKSVPDTSEIAEIMISAGLPPDLTYPDIQPILFGKVLDYLKERGQ